MTILRAGLVATAAWLAAAALAVPGPVRARQSAADSAWLASKGFQQRAPDALLHGGRETIRSWRRRRVSELLESVPRVEIREVAGNDRTFVLHETADWRSSPADSGCILPIYLNGGRMYPGAGRAATVRAVDRAVNLRDLDAIEVHPPENSPVGEAEQCGSVLLWSQRVRRDIDEEFVGRLRGRAFWAPDDIPAGGIAVSLEPGGLRQNTDSGGWFDFGALLPGPYIITARAPDGATWSSRLIVRAFAISQIEIEVSRQLESGRW